MERKYKEIALPIAANVKLDMATLYQPLKMTREPQIPQQRESIDREKDETEAATKESRKNRKRGRTKQR